MRQNFSLIIAALESNARKIVIAASATIALAIAPAVMPQDVPMNIRLTSTLNVAGAPVGQSVMGEVLSPDSFKGDVIKGKVTASKVSKGNATVEFQFDYIHHGGYDYKVMAKIISVQNSNGQANVDEQGHPLHASTIPGKGPKERKLGGNVGGMIGMPSSSAGDPQSGDVPPPSIRVAGEGTDSTLAIGSTLGLTVRSNGLGDLTSLRPNGPEADPYALPNLSDTKPAAVAPTSMGTQPEMKSAAIDFIPGERTIFFDDFSDIGADDIPSRWPAHEGKLDLRTPRDGVPPERYATENVILTSPEMTVPANFTFELEWTGNGAMEWNFRNGKTIVLTAVVHADTVGNFATVQLLGAGGEALGSGKVSADTSKSIEFELWAQQRKMGAYLNGQKVIDVNEFQFAAINHFDDLEAEFRDVAIHKVRVAETTPDFASAINASGKFVTHGIEFDENSDRLKPESAAMLKQIAAALTKDPQLKLEIDAYTDSSGDADHNLKLSRLRAQAVQSVLVTQFGIAATRLMASGFGEARPIISNTTPEGRAENRRMELVKK
jgi:outer membrane protein OmpA-like peptidoglycan-associated protein